MIITKTPFRISFCGGGSDFSDFYKKYGGCVISTSINRYLYVSIHPFFYGDRTLLKYSKTELVGDVNQIQHPIFRQVLQDMNIDGVEITSTADVPSGTGLGSSSAFTVGLLHSLYCYQGKYVSKQDLAAEACRVEIEKLGSPIGKQDQYAAACGGLNFITFHRDGSVLVEPLILHRETLQELERNLVVYYTGTTRNANDILKEQKGNLQKEDKTRCLQQLCDLTQEMKKTLESDDLSDFGRLLDEGWKRKREMASGIANPRIDAMYETAMRHGALGGKLLGAGGGGFLLFYCEQYKQKRMEQALGMRRFPVRFEHDGTSVVYIGDKYW